MTRLSCDKNKGQGCRLDSCSCDIQVTEEDWKDVRIYSLVRVTQTNKIRLQMFVPEESVVGLEITCQFNMSQIYPRGGMD